MLRHWLLARFDSRHGRQRILNTYAIHHLALYDFLFKTSCYHPSESLGMASDFVTAPTRDPRVADHNAVQS